MEVIDQPSVHPVAIVTGASSGIGLEYARELCSRGYDVVMVSNEEERLTRVPGSYHKCTRCRRGLFIWIYHYPMQRNICMVFA
ncbi:MAG: SDR family NAD(P)-dependent oxidoreductase [Butyricimonas faecihominis]